MVLQLSPVMFLHFHILSNFISIHHYTTFYTGLEEKTEYFGIQAYKLNIMFCYLVCSCKSLHVILLRKHKGSSEKINYLQLLKNNPVVLI